MSLIPAEALKQEGLRLGFDKVGVCAPVEPPHLAAMLKWLDRGHHASMSYLAERMDLRSHPASLLPGVQSVVAVALNYNQPNPIVDGEPRIARYALGRDYHKVLRSKLRRFGAWVEREFPGAQSRACVDSAPILEREFASLAGLGWFGKNTCLIDSRRGSWFFIGILLTTVPFERDAVAAGHCGTCTHCIDQCPTGAIVFEDGHWQVDSRKCISYLTIEHRGEFSPEQAAMTSGWTFGCDVCQEVCPFNQPRPTQPERATVTKEPDFRARRQWPNLKQLTQLSDEEWDRLTQGSAVRRTGKDGLRR
ncbi:MAG: tRNA epoxyqueuosine(34) reductase QueG, partial [Fimbriimonas sp.]